MAEKYIQSSMFDWDTVEATKMRKADKKILERAQILFKFKVIVSNLHILKSMLDLVKDLWVGVKFCIADG